MNKTFILFLVVCIISVHAFVRREAPTLDIQDEINKFANQLKDGAQGFGEQLAKALDPDTIKKNFGEIVDNANKAINDFKPKEKQA